MSKTLITSLYLLLLVSVVCLGRPSAARSEHSQNTLSVSPKEKERLQRFGKQLEDLRRLLKIPGLSAAIVKDQQLIWAKGFGFSDYEHQVAATAETPYEIASLTVPLAATLLMQLVEQGKVSLDDPMSKYATSYTDDSVKVRHVLTHTSAGIPGERFQFNGNLFANLNAVMVKASGKPFRLLLAQNLLEKIGATGMAPGNDLDDDPKKMAEMLGEENERHFLDVTKRLAKPYRLYGADEIIRTYNPQRAISPASGMVATVTDLAKYDAALDRHLLLQKQTQERMWTRSVSSSGQPLPYGLGWMVQPYRGIKLIWHNGYLPDCYSAAMVKVPEKNLTLILLANSDALSAPFRLVQANALDSAFVCSFLRLFVFEDVYGLTLPEPNWALDASALAAQLTSAEKQSKGYKYDGEQTSFELMRSWLDARRAAARPEIKLDPKIYEAYLGQYTLDSGVILAITKEEGKLMRQARGVKLELFPESESSFFAKATDVRYVFVKDGSGRVTHLKLLLNGQETIAKKTI